MKARIAVTSAARSQGPAVPPRMVKPPLRNRSQTDSHRPLALAPHSVSAGHAAVRPAPHGFAPNPGDTAPLALSVSVAENAREQKPRDALSQLIDRAIADPAAPLPYRIELERRLGHSLGNIAVYHGPAARGALAKLDARAATQGRQILFAAAFPPLATVAHEVIHVLQSQNSAGVSEPRVTHENAPAEVEAERVATAIAALEGRSEAPIRVANDLPAGSVALQRSTLAAPAPGGVAVAERPQVAPEDAVAQPGPAIEPATTEEPVVPAEATAMREEPPAEGASEPAAPVELPAAPAPGVNPQDVAAREAAVAEAEAILAAARDVDGLMDAFAAAPPTLKAREQAQLGQRISELTQQQNQQFQEELPEFHAELNAQEEPVAPLTVAPPPPSDVTLEQTPPGPAPAPQLPETPELGAYDANAGVARSLNYGLDTDPSARAVQVGESLNDVQTTDPEMPRAAGSPPAIPLGGETDPQRLADQTSEGLGQARTSSADARAAVLNGPGPEQAQPRQMDEPYAVDGLAQPQVAALAPAQGAQAYLTMGLPPEVETAFDQDQQAAMQSSLATATTEVSQATAERDTSRETAVNDALAETDRLSQDADQRQRAQVTAARETIQQERQSTLDAQTKAVNDLETNAETRRQTDRKAIDTRVRDDQEKIDGRYRTADADIASKVAGGERDAVEERRKAERKAEDESWWDRAVSFVRDAFNALVGAIDAIFAAVRSAVNGILDAVKSFTIGLIDAAASFIKGAIAAFGEFLKGAIGALIGDIFPELVAKLNRAIDAAVAAAQTAVDAVANGLKTAVAAVVDGLKAGINKILDVYQAALNLAIGLVEAALTGDWSALARKLLEAVLKVAGIDPETFYGFIGHAEETFQSILDNPGKFVSNLLDAFVGGVRRFAGNFPTHLQAGLIGWLTGTLGSGGITIPERFDLMGVLDLARQTLGLTWERLRAKAVKLVGEKNVARLEFVASYIQDLVVKGWSALWERISGEVASLRDMVLQGIESFLLERVVLAAIAKIASLFNPVGAIVQLVLAAWNLFTFLRDQFQRIAQVVQTVVESIANIARGILEPATAKVETVLAGLLPLAIDLLARLLGLGNISEKVREIISRVQSFIDRAVDKLLQRVLAMFRGGRGASEQPLPQAAAEDSFTKAFQIGPKGHTLKATIELGRVVILMASNGFTEVAQRIKNIEIAEIGEEPGKFHPKSDIGMRLAAELGKIRNEAYEIIKAVIAEPDKIRAAQTLTKRLDELGKMFARLGEPPFSVETEKPFEPPALRTDGLDIDDWNRAQAFWGQPISSAAMGKGRPPSQDPAGIFILAGVPGAIPYERGHLLAGTSEKSLGGPGGDLRNLVPLSRASNREMRDKPEKAARDLIYDDKAYPPYLINYTVRCTYPEIAKFQSYLSGIGAGSKAAENLFSLAKFNTPLTPPAIQSAFDSPTHLLISDELVNIRKQLAQYFMPVRLTIEIAPTQGPILNLQRFTVDNHKV